jgi:hypothetical protein
VQRRHRADQGSADTEETPGRPHVADKRGDGRLAGQLLNQLLAHPPVAVDHVRVVELVGGECAGLVRDLAGAAHHRRDQLWSDSLRAGNQLHLRAKRLHGPDFLHCEGIGGDDPQRITLDRADEGSEEPALPPLYSTTVWPGRNRPSASPASIMARAILSL